MAGIPSKLFHVIYSMYQDTRSRIKFSNGMSDEFSSSHGVKQGGVLSPMLFNLFLDYLVKKLELSNCDPVMIEHIKLNTLL